MRSLIWKEWHEQAWKLGFGCIVLGTLALLGFRARMLADETTAMWICYIGLTLLPITASTGLIPAERGDGTLEMLLALPVTRWRVVFVKIFTGLSLVAGPMLVAMLISIAIARGREIHSTSMMALYLRSIATALMLFVWMLTVTVRLPSEARAGLVTVGVLIIWELATVALVATDPMSYYDTSRASGWSALSPLSFIYGLFQTYRKMPPLQMVLVVQTITFIGLCGLTLKQLTVNAAAD